MYCKQRATCSSELKQRLVSYFNTLFRSSHRVEDKLWAILQHVPRKVTPQMNEALMVPFLKEEVLQRALFQMYSTKALGLNGFPALFYQKFWEITKGRPVEACLRVLNGEALVREFNHTLIVLIPKMKNPVEILNFRLISLCNVSYKIITKTIANRLKRDFWRIVSLRIKALLFLAAKFRIMY